MDLEERLRELEDRFTDLERQFDDLLRVMLSRRKMTPEQRRAIRRKTAAWARADKPVGKGRGAVGTEEIKEKLEQDKKDA
jgi:hypothetical protein